MQREGSHGQSREPQVEGKGKVGSTQIMPHQQQAEAGRVHRGVPAPSSIQLGVETGNCHLLNQLW